jgi:uncharacterized protein (TIGR03437 family)
VKPFVLLFACAALGQSEPKCYVRPDLAPVFASGIITDVANLAARVPADSLGPNNIPNFAANAGTSLPPVASGEILSVIGLRLTSNDFSSALNNNADPSWPLALNGAEVLVNGSAVPLYYAGRRRDFRVDDVAASEVILQLPYNLAGPGLTMQMRITTPAGKCVGNMVTLPVSLASPGLITQNSHVVVQTSPGGAATVYAIGLGDVTATELRAGNASDRAAWTQNPVTATLGGRSALVTYAGVTPGMVGLYQINFQIPAELPAGNYEVQMNWAGGPSLRFQQPIE